MSEKPVIFLAFANAQTSPGRYLPRLGEELQGIRDALTAGVRDNRWELVERVDVQVDDLFRVFRDPAYRDRIAVFHYGGHAGSDLLALTSSSGDVAYAHAAGLADFLGKQAGLSLVFLNGCSTGAQSDRLLSAGVPAVITTACAIDDTVATTFAKDFYAELSGGTPLASAFERASDAARVRLGESSRAAYRAESIDAGQGAHSTHRAIISANDEAVDPASWPWALHSNSSVAGAENWQLDEPVEARGAQRRAARLASVGLAAQACGVIGVAFMAAGTGGIVKGGFLGYFWTLLALAGALGVAGSVLHSRMRSATGVAAHRAFRIRRWAPALGILLATLAVGGWHRYQQLNPERAPESEPSYDPTGLPRLSDGYGHRGRVVADRMRALAKRATAMLSPGDLAAQGLPAAPLQLVSFELVADQTSYVEGMWNGSFEMKAQPSGSGLRSKGPPSVRSFEFPTSGMDRSDRGMFGFADHCDAYSEKDRLLEALRDFVRSRGREDALKYLGSYGDLVRLLYQHGKDLGRILPQGAEWEGVPPAKGREVVLRWLRECAGIPAAMFRITIRNQSSGDVFLTSADYFVLAEGGEAGGADGEDLLQVPLVRYIHTIGPKPSNERSVVYRFQSPAMGAILHEARWGSNGKDWRTSTRTFPPQTRPFAPVMRVPARGVVTFDLQLVPKARTMRGQTSGFLVQQPFGVVFQTSAGPFHLPEFFISMPSGAG